MLILDNDYMICVEKGNYNLCRKYMKKMKDKESGEIKEVEARHIVGFYSRLDAAIDRYLEEENKILLEQKDMTCDELLAFLKERKEKIHEIVYGTREELRE